MVETGITAALALAISFVASSQLLQLFQSYAWDLVEHIFSIASVLAEDLRRLVTSSFFLPKKHTWRLAPDWQWWWGWIYCFHDMKNIFLSVSNKKKIFVYKKIMSYFSVQKKFANGCDHFFVINFFQFMIKKN